MTLKRNIFSNYLGMGVVALAPVLALPWYLGALGPKLFGLIGFVVMFQAVLSLLDAGMSQALVREITVRFDITHEGRTRTAALLFGFERIYWTFALLTGSVTLLLADTIARHWLSLDDALVTSGRNAMFGAAIIFAFQFPGSIYRSLLVGVQVQLPLNIIMLCCALIRHIGGVFVVLAWPTLSAYLIWQVLVSLVETLLRGKWAWQALGVQRNNVKWDSKELSTIWRLVGGMSGAAWLGALTVQMDKIVLSRMASIEQFAYYTIAATVAAGMLQVIYPLVQAVLPRAVQLRAEPAALRSLSFKLIRVIGVLAGLGALIFMVAGKWMLDIWLHNLEVSSAVYPLLAILLVGTVMNAFYNVGYINWIVHEKVRRVFQVNALALILSVLLIPLLIIWLGTIGAAFGWLIINLIGFVLSLEWIKPK